MKATTTIFLIITLFLLCSSDISYAALDNAGVLDTVLQKYKAAASSWATVIQKRATWLFLALTTISLVWTFFPLMFHRSSFPEIFGEMIRFCAFCGFFLWLLTNGPAIADAIILSLRKIGAEAAGKDMLYPSSIVDIGFQVFDKAVTNFDSLKPFVSLGVLLLAAGILVVLALVGINMLLQLCAAWILAYAGIFFLGFGGSRWTSDMAINYFKAVLGLGASLMTMTLLVGVGTEIINEATSKAKLDDLNLNEFSILLVFSITLLLLVDKLPAMVAGIITGASVGSMGVGAFGAGAAVGAAMTTSAAVTGAAAASVASALGGAGAVSAVRAAMQTAGGSQSGSSEGGGRSLSDAMGVKTPFAAAAQNLGKNAAQMAGAGLKGAVDNTKGGKLARKIRENSGGNA